jgi:starch-binding outer membrane protein, SusD/RagB family
MMMMTYRARCVAASLTVAAVGMLVGACNVNEALLELQQPGVIGPGDVQDAVGAEALRIGALQQLSTVTGGGPNATFWSSAGTLADEWKSGDTFFQTDETDRRTIPTNNSQVSTQYQNVQIARGHAITAITALREFSPEKTTNIAQMYFVLGFLELNISEVFCNGTPFGFTKDGTPNYTIPLTNAQGFTLAVARFDSGLALVANVPSTEAFGTSIKRALLLAKARALVDLGQHAAAAALVTAVPTAYAWNMTYSVTTNDNGPYIMNGVAASSRYVVSDSFDFFNGQLNVVKNAVPFASAKDPRVPVLGSTSGSQRAIDAYTPWVGSAVWADRSAPVPLIIGIDARLIEAEAKLQTDDIAGAMTILNALRASPQKLGKLDVPAMSALATPTTKADAISLLFREKAFWTFGRGQRLGDLRRLIRQYSRPQDQVFPVGNYFKSGTYGTDVNLPVTDNELTNPNFSGCINRAA